MSAQTPTSGSSRTVVSLVAGVAVVAIAVVGALLLFGGGGDDKAKTTAATAAASGKLTRFDGPKDAPFRLTVPAGWERVSQSAVEKNGLENGIAVKRTDGSALITLKVDGPVKQGLGSLRSDLNRDLADRFPGMKIVSSRPVDVAAGRALFTSWTQKDKTAVQSNLVVPAGDISYTLDGVFNGESDVTAQEVGVVLRAFDEKK